MAGACRLRQFWRFNLNLTHCGFLGRASAKQSEISENSEHSDGLADARTMVCRSWLTAYPPWRRWGVVWSGTACHRLRGGNYICVLGAPGMSPTPRSAKYPATHSCHRLPGWRKCPPFVIIIAFCHRLRRRRWGCDTSRPRNQMQIPPIQWMINQPNRRRWDAIHIYIDTNIEKWNPHGVGAIAIGSDARLRNPKSLRILTFLEKMDGVEERKSPVNRGFTGLGGEDEIRTRGRITPTTV